MSVTTRGCNIILNVESNELTSHTYFYTLPNGYSINIIHITHVNNIQYLSDVFLTNDTRLIFPPVNSKSPSSISLHISDLTKPASIQFTIEKFGQIPDDHYFDKAFEPILVTGDDGNEYNVIPSNQFK